MTVSTRATIEAFYAAGAALDMAAFFGLLDEDVVVLEPDCLPYGGTYRGVAQVAELMERLAQHLDPSTVKLHELLVDGQKAVATITIGARRDGAELMASEHYQVRDGKIVELRIFFFDPSPICG
jgi:ketosteroid isomerase-like protein